MLRRGGGLARPGGMISPMARRGAGPARRARRRPPASTATSCASASWPWGRISISTMPPDSPCFKIDGKVRLVKESLKFRDMQGNLLYKLDEKVLRIRESFDILKPDGQLAAKVHNAIIDPLRERFTIEIPGGRKHDDHGQGHLGAV